MMRSILFAVAVGSANACTDPTADNYCAPGNAFCLGVICAPTAPAFRCTDTLATNYAGARHL